MIKKVFFIGAGKYTYKEKTQNRNTLFLFFGGKTSSENVIYTKYIYGCMSIFAYNNRYVKLPLILFHPHTNPPPFVSLIIYIS